MAATTVPTMPTAPTQFPTDAPDAAASLVTGDVATTHLTEKEQELSPTANGVTNGTAQNGAAKEASYPKSEPEASSVDLSKAADHKIFDKDGKELPFSELYAQPGKHLIIFIRHFLCGLCEDYVTTITKQLPPSALPSGTTLCFVGNGDSSVITPYLERTGCPHSIYANPDRKLYDEFGMSSNLKMGSVRPEYQQRSVLTQAMHGIGHGLRNMNEARNSGKVSQLGGELLIQDGEVKWCHWMKTTRDHAEIAELRQVLGLAA